MDMMGCPHCGAANSRKRTYCYQCGEDLRAPPRTSQSASITCARCGRAMAAAPTGQTLPRDQVWCMHRAAPVPSTSAASTCFEEGFGWGREQIMD